MDDPLFEAARAAFDAANARDPERKLAGGALVPKALVEADRLSAWIERLEPAASTALRLAARCQHIERWTIPRARYPEGRVGYLTWRTELARFHAARSAAILREVGYDEATITEVRRIVLKQNLKSNPDSQTMEDALCLAFLEHELDDFLAKYPDADKAVTILRKTWKKMSARARAAALELSLSDRAKRLVERALDASAPG